ncbi:prolactin-inducible protein isoform X1 [Callithrix jacchus]
MRLFQLLFRASPAALLLVLCLQLGSNKAQENTTSPRIMIMDFQLSRAEDEKQEVTADLSVKTELKECMVVKAYLNSNVHIESGFNFKYTACLCEENPRHFFWDFKTSCKYRSYPRKELPNSHQGGETINRNRAAELSRTRTSGQKDRREGGKSMGRRDGKVPRF